MGTCRRLLGLGSAEILRSITLQLLLNSGLGPEPSYEQRRDFLKNVDRTEKLLALLAKPERAAYVKELHIVPLDSGFLYIDTVQTHDSVDEARFNIMVSNLRSMRNLRRLRWKDTFQARASTLTDKTGTIYQVDPYHST